MATSGSEHPLAPARGERPRAVAGRPIETFDHLLRDLLAYDLVEKRDDTWCLRGAVAHRVGELVAASQAAGHVDVYVGYPCSRCHATRVTRAVGTSRLCDECIAATADEPSRDGRAYEPSARPPPPPRRNSGEPSGRDQPRSEPVPRQPAYEPLDRPRPASGPPAGEPPAGEPPVGEPDAEAVVDVGTRRLVARHRLPPSPPHDWHGTPPEG